MTEIGDRSDTVTPWPMAEAATGKAGDTHDSRLDEAPDDDDHDHDHDHDHDASPVDAAWIAGGAGAGETRYVGMRLAAMVAVIIAAVVFLGPYALLMILALLVSIVLHEFGHYWTAKRSGMKVTEFFVGFGPRIWSFRRGETEYGIKAIPAGAYVRIIGMNNLEEVDPADEPRSYRQQSAPKRMAVVLAGPFMNLLIAFFLLFAAFAIQGLAGEQWSVKEAQPGSAAELAGVQAGDRILSVDGEPVTTWDNFRDQLNAKAGSQVTLEIERGGQRVVATPTLRWRLSAEGAAAIPSTPPLERSDSVLTADGQSMATWAELRAVLAQPGPPVTVAVDRNGHGYELSVQRPVNNLPEHGAGGFLGIRYEPVFVPETPVGAVGETLGAMKTIVVGTGAAFGHLFTPDGAKDYVGQVVDSTQSPTTVEAATQPGVLTPLPGSPSPDAATTAAEASRPISIVGIVNVGSQAAELGFWWFILLVATVNFALAMINLLPVLPFDGGHAVIAAYEGVRGLIRGEPYRADLTKMLPVVYAVFAILVLIGTTSILLDVLRPPSIK